MTKKRHVPTIGILESLPDYPNSGSIIVMTDSDCISQQRPIRNCYHLFEHFLEIATQSKKHIRRADEASESTGKNNEVLLHANYQLPSDLHKVHEEPLYDNLENLMQRQDAEAAENQIKNSHLNSIMFFDPTT